VSIAGIQESKWFEKEVCPAGHNGYTLSSILGDPYHALMMCVAVRNERVEILFYERATETLRDIGESRKAKNLRMVAKLKVISKRLRRIGGFKVTLHPQQRLPQV